MGRPWWKWLIVIVVIVLIIILFWNACRPQQTTRLVIEMTGGFAYVPTPQEDMLEVAYLNDVNNVSCNVTQIGTELMVIRGKIVSAAPNPAPTSKRFNLNKAVVTFPQFDSSSESMKIIRGSWPPPATAPVSTNSSTDWADLQFVPALREYHSAALPQTWHTLVNGRMVLKGGTVVAAFPSDPLIQQAKFDIKVNGQSKFDISITDKTIYTVDVPGDQIEIEFAPAADGYTKLVLAPNAPGEAVRLTLKGLHAMGSAPSIGDGEPLKDFCAFYSLLPSVATAAQVVPHYKAPAVTAVQLQQLPPGGKPSPGFFCPGGWF